MKIEFKNVEGAGYTALRGDPAVSELIIDGTSICYLSEEEFQAVYKHFKDKLEATVRADIRAELQKEEVSKASETVAVVSKVKILVERHRLFSRMAMAAARRPDLKAVELLDMFSSEMATEATEGTE